MVLPAPHQILAVCAHSFLPVLCVLVQIYIGKFLGTVTEVEEKPAIELKEADMQTCSWMQEEALLLAESNLNAARETTTNFKRQMGQITDEKHHHKQKVEELKVSIQKHRERILRLRQTNAQKDDQIAAQMDRLIVCKTANDKLASSSEQLQEETHALKSALMSTCNGNRPTARRLPFSPQHWGTLPHEEKAHNDCLNLDQIKLGI